MWRIRLMHYGPKFSWWRMRYSRIQREIVTCTNLIPGTYLYLIHIASRRK